MNAKLFVGALAYSVTEEELKELFAKAGNVVSVAVITDRDTGRSKGFGFVEMASEEEAQAAIDMYNQKEVSGRQITVNKAKPMTNREAPRSSYNSRQRY